MGQLVEFGATIQKPGIDKFDCATDVTVKALLINYARPYARNLAYDEVNKCSVECTKEMVLKYGLRPSPRYFFLVAALQTDINGNIIGDKEVKVTFLSMSNNQYEHFLAASNNLDKWNGFVTLTKVQKKGKDGRDMSFVEATPASSNAQGFKGLSNALIDRLASLVKDEELLKNSVQLIDNATGLYEEKYLERVQQNKLQLQQQQQQQGGEQQTQPQLQQPQAAPQLPPKSAMVQTPPAQPDVVEVTATEVDDFTQPVDTNDLPFS